MIRSNNSLKTMLSALQSALLALVTTAGWAQAPISEEAFCFAVADSGDNLVFIEKDGDGFFNGSTLLIDCHTSPIDRPK